MSVTYAQVTEIYIATFDRAPDSAGLDYWVGTDLTIEQIAESFFDQDETQRKYPYSMSNEVFVNTVYLNVYNRPGEAAGMAYWVNELDSGNVSRADLIIAMVNGALGTDQDTLDNKVAVGLYFAANGETLSYDQAVEVMAGVTNDDATVVAAMEQIDEWNDGSAPAAPTIDTIAGDDIVNNAEATAGFDITGTGEAGATVTLVLDSGTTLAGGNTAVVDADGNWSIAVVDADVTAMGEGAEEISATQTDTAGNTSTPTAIGIVVDTVAPTITTGPTIASATTIILTADETATAGIYNGGDIAMPVSSTNSMTITVAAQTTAVQPADGIIIVTDTAGNQTESTTTVGLGTDGSDTLTGSANVNLIFGFAGGDTIDGLGGNDEIVAGTGMDNVTGGTGADIIDLENDGEADRVSYAQNDGSAAGVVGGTLTDFDTVTGFDAGDDKIFMVADAAKIRDQVNGGSPLTTGDNTDVGALTNFFNDLYNDTNKPQADELTLYAITFDDGTTSVYAINNDSDLEIVAGEIQLLGTVDATLDLTDLAIV